MEEAAHDGYLAYALLIAHVALGALQSETNPALAWLLGAGFVTVVVLHLTAAWQEWCADHARLQASSEGFVEVCEIAEIPDNRAKVISLGDERVAVFRYGGKISEISNVRRPQNGPLGEGRIIDGCVTCPWHGYQYLPDSGASPPRFTEKLPTFQTKILGRRVLVHPCPHPAGTRLEPAQVRS